MVFKKDPTGSFLFFKKINGVVIIELEKSFLCDGGACFIFIGIVEHCTYFGI